VGAGRRPMSFADTSLSRDENRAGSFCVLPTPPG